MVARNWPNFSVCDEGDKAAGFTCKFKCKFAK